MGPGIIIPLVIVAIAIPVAFTWAKKTLKDGARPAEEPVVAPSARLTSNALRDLSSPPWRIVYEIAEDKLGGLGHVVIGPAGIFAIQTSMDPLPAPPLGQPDAHAIAAAAIARGTLDDALRRAAMSSDLLVTVHWGAPVEGGPNAVETVPGAVAVDGRSLVTWADQRSGSMSQAQIDLAWQTVTVAIGRPDPLA
jgi:hypothetical protein